VIGAFITELVAGCVIGSENGNRIPWVYAASLFLAVVAWGAKLGLMVRFERLQENGFDDVVSHAIVNCLALFVVEIHGRPMRGGVHRRISDNEDSTEFVWPSVEKIDESESGTVSTNSETDESEEDDTED
jgi:hypothetical protein